MSEQHSSIRIWAGTRLHLDLGAARLGQDFPGPARILMLDCLFYTGRLAHFWYEISDWYDPDIFYPLFCPDNFLSG